MYVCMYVYISGLRLHVLADDGVWYPGEVLKASRTKQGKARVKVKYVGYADHCDEWVTLDRLRSKVLQKAQTKHTI